MAVGFLFPPRRLCFRRGLLVSLLVRNITSKTYRQILRTRRRWWRWWWSWGLMSRLGGLRSPSAFLKWIHFFSTGIIGSFVLILTSDSVKAPHASPVSAACSGSSLVSEHSDGMKQPESLGQSLSSSCWPWEDLCSPALLVSSPATAKKNKLSKKKIIRD